jgi:hypothetical protein
MGDEQNSGFFGQRRRRFFGCKEILRQHPPETHFFLLFAVGLRAAGCWGSSKINGASHRLRCAVCTSHVTCVRVCPLVPPIYFWGHTHSLTLRVSRPALEHTPAAHTTCTRYPLPYLHGLEKCHDLSYHYDRNTIIHRSCAHAARPAGGRWPASAQAKHRLDPGLPRNIWGGCVPIRQLHDLAQYSGRRFI